MRILMLSQFYFPIIGGAEQHVRSLSGELIRRGHHVAVVTMQHAGQAEREMDNGIEVYRVRGFTQRMAWLFSNTERRHAPPLPDPGVVAALRHILQLEKPDIVHAHNWMGRSFLPLKAESEARLVVTLHDYNQACATSTLMYRDTVCDGPASGKCMYCVSSHYGGGKGIPTLLANRFMSIAQRRATDKFLAVSRAVARGNGFSEDDESCCVVPNFLPEAFDACGYEVESYVTQLPGEAFLLFVGALSRAKGVDVLLNAYRDIQNAPPLVLIGYPTPDWESLDKNCPRNVFVFKNWPRVAVIAAWHRSLIGLAPSSWPEPCSTVVMEAMCAGRPVIATCSGGMTDLIINQETGLLVPPHDCVALRQAIERLLEDANLRTTMGSAAQRKAEDFRVGAVVSRVEYIYEGVLAPGSGKD